MGDKLNDDMETVTGWVGHRCLRTIFKTFSGVGGLLKKSEAPLRLALTRSSVPPLLVKMRIGVSLKTVVLRRNAQKSLPYTCGITKSRKIKAGCCCTKRGNSLRGS